MGNINIIDKNVINKIAAGEVIERPSSVVKECLENSLDSGADSISIYISNENKDIRVVDNGEGIRRDDAHLVFAQHCTSKLLTADDLTAISTLGFRGEALASIAAISMITLNTFCYETKESTKIEVKNGEVVDVSDSSILLGTDIEIKNLFYNTPVREKFLKSPRAEESQIANLISRFILANPEISVKYIVNGITKLQFNGDGLEKAIYTIYGKDAAKSIIEVNDFYKNILIEGYIGKPSYTKPNRTYQTIVLNGRIIENQTISTSAYNAFKPFLMKRRYPFFVLNITIDSAEVDVNVHPTKKEVRFADDKMIYSRIYHSCLDAINKDKISRKVQGDFESYRKDPDNKLFQYSEKIIEKGEIEENKKIDAGEYVEKYDLNNYAEYQYDMDKFDKCDMIMNNKVNKDGPSIDEINNRNNPDENFDLKQYNISELTNINKSNGNSIVLSDDEDEIISKYKYSSFNIIGVFHNTYILAEYDNKFYMIDQHAGHERVLYEDYLLNYSHEKLAIQDLLVPYVFSVNDLENEFFRAHLSDLFIIGIKIEPFGDKTFRICSLPATIVNLNFDKFFADLFSHLNEYNSINEMELLRESIMQTACKHAIKAGQKLTGFEIKDLFDKLERICATHCPHGRPIVKEFSLEEIEKMFKRRV